jgi:DNA helicase-2/ATP-dependent DNA helicase PcrA
VLGLLPGVGARTARALLEPVQRTGSFDGWSEARVPSAAREQWPALVGLCRELAAPQPPTLPSQLHRIRAFYGPLCEERYDHVPARLRDLEQLEQLAAGFADRATFLAELTLEPPRSTQELAGPPSLDEDHLVLSTIHSAKGLEFDAVYVLHAADGNIPSDLTTGSPEEIDEELRLLYVALSRARRHLSVTFPLRWFDRPAGVGGRHALAQLTRFLPPPVAAAFELRTAFPHRPAPVLPAEDAFLLPEVRTALRSLWN